MLHHFVIGRHPGVPGTDTGSVNQHGHVQPIGGVNEKIEGFFDICVAKGLNGEQGVIIAGANVPHLMLRNEVVDAAKAGTLKFTLKPHTGTQHRSTCACAKSKKGDSLNEVETSSGLVEES